MKTINDIIKNSNDQDIIKSYKLEGNVLNIKSYIFKMLFNVNNVIKQISGIYWVFITKKNNLLEIKIKKHCDKCEGTGEKDCDECSGEGKIECYNCGHYNDCDECKGRGVVTCMCDEEFDEDEVYLEDIIDLNQYIFDY